MEPLFKLPIIIVRQYLKVLKQNFNGTIPKSDLLIFWIGPALVSLFVAYFTSFEFDVALIGNLLTIHGIFISVLVTSYVPFLDYIQDGGRPSAQTKMLDAASEMEDARLIVKGLLFAINSFSILLSLLVIVALILFPLVNGLTDRVLVSIGGFDILKVSYFKRGFLAVCLYMIQLNTLNIFRTVQVIFTIVSPKLFR